MHETLVRLSCRHSITRTEAWRIELILHLHGRAPHFKESGKKLKHSRNTVSKWHYRALDGNRQWPQKVQQALSNPGHAGPDLIKQGLALTIVADPLRSGSPPSYSPEQYTRIIAVVLKDPSEYGRPITHWTARELQFEGRAAAQGDRLY